MSFYNNKNGKRFSERIETFISTEGQTVFILSNSYNLGENRLQVIIGGVRQFAPINFNETNSTTFTLTSGIPADLDVIAIY